MKITAECYVEMLKIRYSIEKYGDFEENYPISGVSLWTGGPAKADTLYLSIGAEPVPGIRPLYIVTNGETPKGVGWYLTVQDADTMGAVNHFFRVWMTFQQWRERCRDLARVQHDLSALLDAGAEYLGTDMVIIDRDYRYDGGSLSGRFESNDFFSTAEDMDAKAVEDLYVVNPRFDETFQTDGLVPYPYPGDSDHVLYYYNLRYDGLYLGRLLLRIPEELDSLCLRHLADGFGALVSECYEYHYLRKNQGMPRHSVYDAWKQILAGQTVDQAHTDQQLASMGWRADDRYRIAWLISNGYFRSQETLKFYAVQLEQNFPACIAAQADEGIFMLHNLDRETDPDFRQKLAGFLREHLLIVGISNVFSDFYDSRRYAGQGREALKLGLHRNPSLWRFEFRDYLSDYVMQQCLSQYSARDLCSEGLEKLIRFDTEHPEMELARTLEMYYNCKFNAAEAAKKLFIHRTTMFYRLNKIQEIADIDHDNPEARLHLMLSFALLREEQNRSQATAQ